MSIGANAIGVQTIFQQQQQQKTVSYGIMHASIQATHVANTTPQIQ